MKSMGKMLERRFVTSFVSLSVLMLIFFAGPAQAFILGLELDDVEVSRGEDVVFTMKLDIEKMDKYLPVKNMTLSLDGKDVVGHSECVFDLDGSVLSGCEDMTIRLISKASSEGKGYGYGYENTYGYGYGYDFGYGYGYGYDSGAVEFEYEITLNTTNYQLGIYETLLETVIGSETFSKKGEDLAIIFESTGPVFKSTSRSVKYGNTDVDCGEWSECSPSGSQSRTCKSSVGNTIVMRNCEYNNTLPEDNQSIVLFDEKPEPQPGFFARMLSRITGAVTGVTGAPEGLAVGGFMILIFSGFVAVRIKRKRSLA